MGEGGRISLSQGKNSVAAFIGDNLEPATHTLDIVRLVFHFCNFVNLTLGAINFGVGIGYEVTPITVSGSEYLSPIQTKFVVTGVFVLIHGIIGAIGFVSRQSRSLIVYGCLGLCLLIVGSIAAWTALTDGERIITNNRNQFYGAWLVYQSDIDHSKEGDVPTPVDSSKPLTENDYFIYNLLWVEKSCHMQYIPEGGYDSQTELSDTLIVEYQEYKYYTCKKTCTETDNCDSRCDKNAESTYDADICANICNAQDTFFTCLKYVADLTKNRILTIYATLFLLSFTQSVCLLCDILFIFWSLKEEADIEIHKNMIEGRKKFSTKLRLLSRFLPCCFSLPTPMDYSRARNTALALSEIISEEEGEEGEYSEEEESAAPNTMVQKDSSHDDGGDRARAEQQRVTHV